MLTLGWVILFLALAVILAFNRVSLVVWSISYGLLLILVSLVSSISLPAMVSLWVIFLLLVVLFNLLPLRRQIFSKKALSFYHQKMPRLSLTERQALTAGNVGWEGELFSGMPDWDKLKNIPKGKLSTEEQAFLEGPVEELCGMINDWDINQRWFTIPDFIWEHLKHHGFFGLIIPKKYGGKEFSALAHTQILTKISSVKHCRSRSG
ncbi:acyl-CoA dehydrogenase family protein [Coxiella burnetii]|uniref:acyl-CoA dehydrogenase family protein n=1 Tax=Coxiella burnetii TaxID=777 RepID=UPI0021ADCE90|nr:acyl-CoA dehydrogenase family protein [Coxiella burnetii]